MAKDDKLWTVFSEYIRLRDSDKNGICKCITCGRAYPWAGSGKLNAGHYISRGEWGTRYDEKNVNAQCVKCNKYESGRAPDHAKAIDLKYCKGTAESLYIKSKMFTKALNDLEIHLLTKEYREKVKQLKKEKGL